MTNVLAATLCFLFVFALYHCTAEVVVSDFVKVDCHPSPGATESVCLSRGCKWTVSAVPDEPWCFFSYEPSKFAGYTVANVTANTSSFVQAVLNRLPTPSLYGGDDNIITLKMTVLDKNMLNIRFETEEDRSNHLSYFKKRMQKTIFKNAKRRANDQHMFSIDLQKKPFGIRVIRTLTGEVLFNTFNISGFTHSDQFLSITTRTPTEYIYGFGEHVHRSLKHNLNWKKWGMFARDEPSGGSDMNLYGVHPFYIAIEKKGNAHGVFFINSNAQSVQFSPDPSITLRTIGGNLDMVIFMGPTPEDVVQQYNKLIGTPILPPYWALGFHLCRYGYKSTEDVKRTLLRNQRAGIPQDVQWLDIDYMDKVKDFTYDAGNFNKLPDFAKFLKSSGMALVPIIEPAIASEISGRDYPPLSEGLEQNVFLLDSRTEKPLQSKVWPGLTYFVDWTSPNASKWWTNHMKQFYNVLQFDGIWLDMNEPANFVHGSMTGCANNKWNNPPFVPLKDQNINTKTACMDAKHAKGRHYDYHSMYGLQQSAVTNHAFHTLIPDKRPFILSRSTFPSSGTHTFHWTGDNTSEWPDLLWSIIGSIEFNFFGMPFVGADICGFNKNSTGGNATEELCTRWMQLGAFYPFSRSHNSNDKPDQDPAVWSLLSINSSRNALLTRYKFLPYLYSLLWQSNIHGTTIMRPLFFEFPTDPETYDIADQFLWGSGLMVVPILTPGITSRKVYFPKSRWFLLHNGTEVELKENRSISVPIGLYEIGLYAQGGTIIPWQEPAQNTAQSRRNPMGLLVALDALGSSTGFLFWDDGFSPLEKAAYSLFNFRAMKNSENAGALIIHRLTYGYKDNVKLDTIQIYGVGGKISSMKLNNVSLPAAHVHYNAGSKVLTLNDLHLDVFNSHESNYVFDWVYSLD